MSNFLVHVFVQTHAHIILFGKNTNHVVSGHCCRILRLPRARNQGRDYGGKVTLTSLPLFTVRLMLFSYTAWFSLIEPSGLQSSSVNVNVECQNDIPA